jgi:predicted RNA-binding Zn-ribbon protein involved in translation (DUF1610 family)
MAAQPERIQCPACGENSVLKRQPIYDDNFRKTGEKLSCAACGHRFADEAGVVAKAPKRPSIFDDDEPAPSLKIFAEDERQRCCRYCRHYIVNPFTQRCAFHNKLVEATDSCDRFDRKPDPGKTGTGS